MKARARRSVLRPGVMPVFLVALILLAAGSSTQVTAQRQWEFWNTSADAPEGTPPELLAAPDAVTSPNRGQAGDTPALVLGLRSWRVTGSALQPRENDVSYGTNSNGSCAYVTAGDANTVWNAVPALPDGTVVQTLRMYYSDTSASNSSAWFTVYDLYGAIVQEWSVSTSGNSGNGFNDSAQIDHAVNYSLYSYLVNWRPSVTGSTMQLCGFRVFHETPLPPPGTPQSLTATVSGRTVFLAWSPPAVGAVPTGYVLEAGSAPGLSDLATVPVAGTSLVANNVPPRTYYLRVRAVNTVGSGQPTADVTVVVP